MGQAKKVRGREEKFRLALALGRTVAELESSMCASEYDEWMEYFSTVPTIQETQMAQLLYIQYVKAGVKHIDVEDFMATKTDNRQIGGIDSMTAEEIDALIAGV